jgi:hypothetical protein
MKITNQSQQLMSFFMQNKCFNNSVQRKKTQKILKNILIEIKNGFDYINENKKELGDNFYKLNISNEIPRPKTFETIHFPEKIMSIRILQWIFTSF